MRSLWIVRPNLEQHPGGDTVQILQTAAALRDVGVDVDFTTDLRPNLTGYDVVHLFHLDRLWEHVPACLWLRKHGTPTVLSTIYWPSDDFDRGARAGLQGALSRLLGSDAYRSLRLVQRGVLDALRRRNPRLASPRLFSFVSCVRLLLDTAHVILPNSVAELDVIERQFNVRPSAVVVPNAVDASRFSTAPTISKRAGVLCVGRIEPRKNQLALIRAMRDMDEPLTLVGKPGRFSQAYYEACRKEAGPHTHFIEQQTQEQLGALYAAAKVHACVSWYETPGLASLEAGLCGCALAVTPGGCTREYFGEDACYCEPDDVASIRAAVATALRNAPPPGLAAHIARDCTWQAAAQRTLEGYELALASQRNA